MRLKDIFSRKPDPRTAHLQKGDEKYKKTKEFIIPPVDENGNFILGTGKGITLTEATRRPDEKKN